MSILLKNKLLHIAILTCTLVFAHGIAGAQTYLETFGQNRLQYRKFNWRYFDTKHFRIYHYDAAGRQLGRYVAEEAERETSIVEKKLGGQFPKRFNIILYNNYDEYRQTNIGLKYDAQIQDVPAGTVDLVGDKLVVYFTGTHTDLRHQIRSGMAKVVMERMIFGENFRQMVKNAVLLNLPAWTTDGFIAYLVDGWKPEDNSEWKNLLAARPNTGFYELGEEYPELAGKAFWAFVAQKYGDNGIKNMLYTMELKSSLNQGMKQVLSMKVKKAYDSCMSFYKNVFAVDAQHEDAPNSSQALLQIKAPHDNNAVIRSIKVSPRGSDVAYVELHDGEYKVYIQKTQKEKQLSLILYGGRKDYSETNDPNYPLLAWSNSGYKLGIIYKKGPETRLRIYNSIKAKIENYTIPRNRFDRVLGMTFMEDDDNIVFSAIKKSQTDLYEFRIKGSRMTNITNDVWDDEDPWFVSGGSRRGIVFISNRPKPDLNVPLGVNELPTGPMNVFFYDTKTRSAELLQCSDVTKGNVTQPIQYGSDNFAFLYDSNGVRNQYVVLFGRDKHNSDSAYAAPITNYRENIISQQYNPASNKIADVVREGNVYNVFLKKLEYPGVNTNVKTLVPTIMSQPAADEKKTLPGQQVHLGFTRRASEETTDGLGNIDHGNTFQSEFQDTGGSFARSYAQSSYTNPAYNEPEPNDTAVLKDITDSSYLKMRSSPYRLSFKPDFFTVRVDNSILFSQYQSFQGNGGSFSNPPLSALATISLNDLMENHRFTAGLQLPINFSGSTYFLQYENFEHYIDYGLLFLRTENYYNYLVTYTDNSGQTIAQKEQLGKTSTNMLQGSATYPIDKIRSIRLHVALRQDVTNLKATDSLSLTYDLPNAVQYWTMSRLEFVFDNTRNPALNIWNGFRYKFYVEELYGMNNANPSCYNLGTDFRYYHKIYKNFIWATRIAAAHSDGTDKVVYYMGGVDNWINPQYSNYVPVNGGPYGFQALADNLRGYDQNARNGNTYALLNMELRLPVLTTFLKRPIQSTFLKNLQLVGFLDAGDAWNGFLPNAQNTTVNYTFPTPNSLSQGLNNVLLNLTVPNSSGLAVGYGAGIRTMLLGYFFRVDAAWNIEGIKKPIWYFSIGTDF